MVIRAFKPEDTNEIEQIHWAHFRDECDLPDYSKFVCAFVVEDNNGIVTAGGIRNLADCFLVTDKKRDPFTRGTALYMALDAAAFVAGKSGYKQIYANSADPKWTKRLLRTGFRYPRNQIVILDL